MMSLKMMMEMKEVNEPKPMEEWTNWTIGNEEHIILASA